LSTSSSVFRTRHRTGQTALEIKRELTKRNLKRVAVI
jgi:hypothetical protein